MASIENRIVQMQFDNASFEKRLADTLKSIDRLNQTIANAGSKNGLQNLESSVKGFNLDPLMTSIEGVSSKFLAMSTIAITVLSKVAGAAFDAGVKIVSSLSLDPVIDGFQEYSTQIGAIQTILSNTDSKGTTLDQVNAALDQLNTYSDKTIYNFTEMTKNIGTFTAAGVDLDTSVQSIKGIANLAAISGSNSQQASTAMYQLSQAIATGSVKLMDWNSVVNAGMGGEVFQKALFTTGKQMGTITDVPMSQTFEQWTDAGNSFRGSLESGWLTADVLTKTLAGFTGELTHDQILAMGYTEDQAKEIERLGQLGVDAATKVRTLKGLIDTTKEALGSGWASTFRIIFGDFNEATTLFTSISDKLGSLISKSADARNALLQGWSDLGGRLHLIKGLQNAFEALGQILAPIREAFANVFPPLTAQRLVDLTVAFADFTERLKPSPETIDRVKRIFDGFFGALEIGWTVLKETAKFIGELLGSFSGAGSGAFLEFAAKIGDFFSSLNAKLVTEGGIAKFFDDLPARVKPVVDKIIELKDTAIDFFEAFIVRAEPVLDKLGEIKDKVVDTFQVFIDKLGPVGDLIKDVSDRLGGFFSDVGGGAIDVAADSTDRLRTRFDQLKDALGKLRGLWDPFKEALAKVADILDQTWDVIHNWFAELGRKLKEVIGPGDFDSVVDAVNVGLLGAIAAILAKFLKNGFKFDLGGGLFEGITKSFEQLTGVLSAMQTNLKADALLKIAGAIGILTASVLVLSLIDSAALTKSLTAMAVGFGQLIGAFALMNKVVSGPRDAAKLTLLATGLIALSGALLIFSVAVKVLSTMSWEELGKGIGGVTALLLILTLAAGPLGDSAGGMIRAGVGMIAIGVALNILAGAVKIFGTMDWSEMAKGFAGIGIGLALVALAMKLMPNNMILTSAGLLLTSVALTALAGAVMLFSTMDWSEMAKGFVGVGGGLLIIAGAMNLMPANLPLTAIGLLLVSVSLGKIADALAQFGGMDWGDIGKGLVAMGGSLIVLAAGAYAMSGAIVGAVAIGVMAVSLTLLVTVIKEMAKIKIGDLVKAMVGLAAVFAVLGGAALLLAPITPALLALGAALILVGAGFALFGVGAALVATAFETLAKIGPAGLNAVGAAIDLLIAKLPALITAFADGLIGLAQVILDAAPVLIDSLGVVIQHVIDTLITLLPGIGELIGGIIQTVIDVLRDKIPEYIQLGIDIILALLNGIKNNIEAVVAAALEIIENFIRGITDGIPGLVGAVANLIATFINAIASHLGEIVTAGVNLLTSFLDGIGNNLGQVTESVGNLIAKFVESVVGLYGDIIDAGVDALIQFLKGITNNLVKVTEAVGEMVSSFVKAVGDTATRVAKAGTDTLVQFLKGISDNLYQVTFSVASMMIRFINGISQNAVSIAYAGAGAIINFVNGMAGATSYVVNAAFRIIIDFINGLADAIRTYSPQLRAAGINLATAIIDGLTFGIANKAGAVADKVTSVAGGAVNVAKRILGIGGPSKVFCEIGKNMMEGAAGGIASDKTMEKATVGQIDQMTNSVRDALNKFTVDLGSMDSMNPTITPVLDLTQVEKDAQRLGTMMPTSTITPSVSTATAQTIASTQTATATDVSTAAPGSGDIVFQQTINAPAQLSTGDIYRSTRSQLQLAKEELSIP